MAEMKTNAAAPLLPVDPQTGKPLMPKEQPGYYPGFSTLSQQKYWDKTTRDLVHKRVKETRPIRFFTPHEAQTMEAVVGRVLPQDDRTPERQISILPGIDDRLYSNRLEGYRFDDMPPDQDAYRIAVLAFDQMAETLHNRLFHELGVPEQEAILKQVHDAKPLAAADIWKRMNIERFWTMLVSDCCAVYYAHPWAWDEVGFGGPAYPRGYMRLEEGEPEPWEVDEQRYEWAAPPDTISNRDEKHGSGAEHQTQHGQGGTH